MSDKAPDKFPDSSPAFAIETKSLEKTLGNSAKPDENVPPPFISVDSETKILFEILNYIKQENARWIDKPALSIPLKFLVKIIWSLTLTRPNKSSKFIFLKENPSSASETAMGKCPRDLNSRATEKRDSDSIVPSMISPSWFLALYAKSIIFFTQTPL